MITTVVPVDLAYPTQQHVRTPGVHLSRIIKGMALENGSLKPEWADDLGLVEVGNQETWWAALDPASRLRMSIGLAWEDWYIAQLKDVVDHPGEMHVDGIYMTHDGESLDVIITPTGEQSILALHEVKATYKSTRTVGDLSTSWMWLMQCQGYCKGLGTTVAYLHVLFICGDYMRPITPQLKRWRIEFTPEEIEKSWDEMREYMWRKQVEERA